MARPSDSYWQAEEAGGTPLIPGLQNRENAVKDYIEERAPSAGIVQVRPEDHGAVGDGTTDDAAAIEAAIDDAVAQCIADGSFYCEVPFGAKVYQCTRNAVQSAAKKAYSQIPLPLRADTARKVTLVLKGVNDVAALAHWNQTDGPQQGAVLRSTLVGTQDGTWGEPSVIGGPTPAQGYGSPITYSNLLVVVDGVMIVVPDNPRVNGFDFRGIAEANVRNGACFANVKPANRTNPSASWQAGLLMPQNGNNAYSEIGEWSAEGINIGCYIDEHTNAKSIRGIFCVAAMAVGSANAGFGHTAIVTKLCAEACDVGISKGGGLFGGFPIKLRVLQMDFETLSFAIVNDPENQLLGDVTVSQIGGTVFDATDSTKIRGCAAFRVYDAARTAGIATAPAVPASTVALKNPFWRDAFVHIAGGTVSAINVDGQALGVTSGMVMVPTGKSITLTYTVAPSWKWTLT